MNMLMLKFRIKLRLTKVALKWKFFHVQKFANKKYENIPDLDPSFRFAWGAAEALPNFHLEFEALPRLR